jgi:hypothetical protein
MSDRKQLQCPYCLGEGKLPKLHAIAPATNALPAQGQYCVGCGGTGQLKSGDWEVQDGAGGWAAPAGTM